MSQLSELAAELAELRHCGEVLMEIADTLSELFSAERKEPEAEEPREAPCEEKQYSFLDVRSVLTEKSRAGKTALVKALLNRYGADKLSEIRPEDYAMLVEEAEKL